MYNRMGEEGWSDMYNKMGEEGWTDMYNRMGGGMVRYVQQDGRGGMVGYMYNRMGEEGWTTG